MSHKPWELDIRAAEAQWALMQQQEAATAEAEAVRKKEREREARRRGRAATILAGELSDDPSLARRQLLGA